MMMRLYRDTVRLLLVLLFLSSKSNISFASAEEVNTVPWGTIRDNGRTSNPEVGSSFLDEEEEMGTNQQFIMGEEGQRVVQKLFALMGEQSCPGDDPNCEELEVWPERFVPQGGAGRNRRHLQESCGQTLATYNSTQLRSVLSGIAGQYLSGNDLTLFSLFVLPGVVFGVSVRKICAKCTDFPGLCASGEYGANVTHSGLVMFPTNNQGQHVPGTHVGSIYCHGTEASNQDTPSNQWGFGTNATDRLQTYTGAFYSGLAASTVVFPDYMGYVDSAYPELYRSYIIRQAYVTATLPLWYRAQEIIRQESNCQAAIADAVVVTGYSEGGYAAVSVAQALYDRGDTEIVKVFAGGAPFRLSSAQLIFTLQELRNNTLPTNSRYYLALLGTAFSSTNPSLPNYQQGQDFLSDSVKQNLIDVVNGGQGQSQINSAINITNMLSVINPIFLKVFEDAIARGESEPCVTSVIVGENDLICKALQQQDLAKLLETTVRYPVEICHSVDDKLVGPGNRPDFTLNPNYLTSIEITGGVGHASAGPQCIVNAITWYVSANNVLNRPNVVPKHLANCPPTAAPTNVPSASPTGSPTSSTAPTTSSVPSSAPKAPTIIPKDAPDAASGTGVVPTSSPTSVAGSTVASVPTTSAAALSPILSTLPASMVSLAVIVWLTTV